MSLSRLSEIRADAAWHINHRLGPALRRLGFKRCPYHGWVRTTKPNCPKCSKGGMRWTAVS